MVKKPLTRPAISWEDYVTLRKMGRFSISITKHFGDRRWRYPKTFISCLDTAWCKSLKVIKLVRVPSKKTDGGSTTKKDEDTPRVSSPTRKEEVTFWGFMQVFPGFFQHLETFLFGISRMFGAMNWPQMFFHVFSTHQFWRICHNITFWTCGKKWEEKLVFDSHWEVMIFRFQPVDGWFGPIWKCVVQSPFRLMGDAAEDILQCFRPTHLLIAIAQHVPCDCF